MLEEITVRINTLLKKQKTVTIAVCGGSCTRKTSLVSSYISEYYKGNCTLISQDQFQLQPHYLKNIHPTYGFDHPDNFGIDACYNALIELQNNQPVEIPNYTFKKDKPITTKVIEPAPVVIFEGLYTNFKSLKEINDISIYVESMWFERMLRRVFRNTLDRYKNREVSSVLDSFCTSVTKAHQDFIVSQKNVSDFIFNSNLDFASIIKYYNIKPVKSIYNNENIIFSVQLNQDIVFEIEENHLQNIGWLYYKNISYLKFKLNTELTNILTSLNWFSF